ncbi:MAG: 2-C-methyl-D-erythritol 2,4-cyclodiphosphate synthase [Chloroflexi bacterium]|nr:2-C-methyl-D-erythritol 2,4-cyclodiphosphate synthase [Chloroflexota bacterium]
MLPEYRVGTGYDLHRLGAGRPLRVAGVDIAPGGGAIGHSDADVAMHALVDALLGATGSGDIGRRYPNTDPANRDADSSRFVAETIANLRDRRWELVNADLTVVLERPKVSPFADAMRERLAAALGTDAQRISLKAKTNEGVDAVGAAKAVACHAVVLVARGVA